jgi:hypothetical protein
MVALGLVDEGLAIVRALRSRYDGRVRNPWNEYECGSYYARAMASYALLPALSGFSYSAATHCLSLDPRLEPEGFTVFFSTATGWGTASIQGGKLSIDLSEGELRIDELQVTLSGKKYVSKPGVVVRAGSDTLIDVL